VAAFSRKNSKLSVKAVLKKIRPRFITAKKWQDVVEIIQPNFYINKISKCSTDVYVDTLLGVEQVKLQLQLRSIELHEISVSQTPYFTLLEYWKFLRMPWSATVTMSKLSRLVESGIVKTWRLWQFRLETWNNRVAAAQIEQSGFKPLSNSNSNLVAVFYFHCFGLLLAIGAFLFEKRGYYRIVCKQILALVSDIRYKLSKAFSERQGKNTRDAFGNIQVVPVKVGQAPCEGGADPLEALPQGSLGQLENLDPGL